MTTDQKVRKNIDPMRNIMSQKDVNILNVNRKKIFRILITFVVMKHLEIIILIYLYVSTLMSITVISIYLF